jgi:hypothetical protein
MARQVHLVGSVGLRDAETVFTTVSVMLGSCCPRIPDGETGERGYWIRWQRNTFARNLGFEEVMTTRSLPGFNGNVARTFFTLRKDTDPEKIELGELGYARAATDSYRIFTRLIDEGKVAADVRFQVSLPTPTADEPAHKCRPRFGHSRGPPAPRSRRQAGSSRSTPRRSSAPWNRLVTMSVSPEAFAPR